MYTLLRIGSWHHLYLIIDICCSLDYQYILLKMEVFSKKVITCCSSTNCTSTNTTRGKFDRIQMVPSDNRSNLANRERATCGDCLKNSWHLSSLPWRNDKYWTCQEKSWSTTTLLQTYLNTPVTHRKDVPSTCSRCRWRVRRPMLTWFPIVFS